MRVWYKVEVKIFFLRIHSWPKIFYSSLNFTVIFVTNQALAIFLNSILIQFSIYPCTYYSMSSYNVLILYFIINLDNCKWRFPTLPFFKIAMVINDFVFHKTFQNQPVSFHKLSTGWVPPSVKNVVLVLHDCRFIFSQGIYKDQPVNA